LEGDIYEVSAGEFGVPNDWVSAVDGDPDTGWYVCTNGWMDCLQTVMEIDLGEPCQAVEIGYSLSWDSRPEYGTAAVVEIALSSGGTEWDVIDERAVERDSVTTIDLSSTEIQGRYLRFLWSGAVDSPDNDWNGWGNVYGIEAWCVPPGTL